MQLIMGTGTGSFMKPQQIFVNMGRNCAQKVTNYYWPNCKALNI